ncbi:MAG: hypothetical protein ACLPTF_00590 [Steroidobacteraceae bacterium]
MGPQPNLPRLLLVHYRRQHFEVVLALIANLHEYYDLSVWSNFLHVFDRKALLSGLGVALFDASLDYDALVIVSGEETPEPSEAGPELWRLLGAKPVIRIMHRWRAPERLGELRLFPKTTFPFIPCITNLVFPNKAAAIDRRSFLVQGNVENRRNYGMLSAFIEKFPQLDFNVVGIKSATELKSAKNLYLRFNQTERDFHSICASSTFILPLIDPVGYKQYFVECFSSSIFIGFAYNLPFIAHRDLFNLYPIVGYPYSTQNEFLQCLESAATCDADHLEAMRHQLVQNRAMLKESNIANFKKHLEAVADTAPSRGV